MGKFQYQKLGETLRQIRSDRNAGGIKVVASEIGVDYSNLSKVENGYIKPSRNLLDKLIAFYEIPATEASQLYYLAGEREGVTFKLEEAKKQRASGVFEHKYTSKVSIYIIGNYSKEICSGPHVNNTSELGHFKITKEEAVAAGIRRIKAVLE